MSEDRDDQTLSNSKLEDDALSQNIFLKSIRTEKQDPFFRDPLTGGEERAEAGNTCFGNCRRMLCDRSRAPDQLEIYEAYQGSQASLLLQRRDTPRYLGNRRFALN